MFKPIHFSPAEPLADPASRARPKFSSFDASRPGLFAPRPFQREPCQRERRSSDGASCTSEEDHHSQASSSGSCGEPEPRQPREPSAPRERIIPIRLEGADEADTPVAPPPPQRPARKHSRRDTVDGAIVEPPRDDRDDRDVRAQSCPVTSASAGAAATADAGAANGAAKFAPLKVGEALASQQREAKQAYGKPNYFNVSPKPFSPGVKPFQAASFGMFGAAARAPEPAPAAPAPRPPPVPPKPSAAEIRAAKHHPQAPQKPQKPQAPRSAKEEALSKIAAIHADLDPLTRRLEAFAGAKGDKEYRYLDEMLTRGLIKLDGLETGGDGEVRSARKEAVRRIEESLSALERRTATAGGVQEKSGVAGDAANSAVEKEGVERSGETVGVKVNGVAATERRAASAPPQGLARAEPAVVNGHDAPEGAATASAAGGAATGAAQRRVSAEEASRR